MSRMFFAFVLAGLMLVGTFPQFALTGPAAPAAPQRGGTLIVLGAVRPDNLDPGIHFSTITNRISQNTHDPLVHMVDPNTFVPGLAERWQISSDFKTFTFFLRRDVRFHDDTPLTAEAVKATWERTLDPANRATARQLFGTNPRIELPDTHTVRISFTEPHPQFLQAVSRPQLAPGSPTAWQRLGRAYLNAPIGAGPFKVEGYRDENTLVLTRFDAYRWGPPYARNRGSAYVDRIIFRFVPEEGGRTLALEKKEAHIADEVARQKIPTWKSPAFQLLTFKVPGLPQAWPFNTTRWPTNIQAVRQAASYAIDRDRVVRFAFFGTTTPAYGPLTTNMPAFWPEAKNYYRFDRQKAIEILQQAGFKRNPGTRFFEQDGRTLRMRLVTSSTDDQVRSATVVQAMLREVGIDLVVEAMVTAASFARYEANDYELGRQGLNTVDPDGLAFAYHSSRINSPGVSNRGRLNIPELDRLLERGRVLTNPEERKQVYFQVQKILLDLPNALYTFESNYYTVGLACVQGFRWNAHGYTELLDVSLEGECRRIGN